MEQTGFIAYLKRQGKKQHVAEGMASQVKAFERFLSEERQADLSQATPDDIAAYAAMLEARKKGLARTSVRGIAIYYGWCGTDAVAGAASAIRQKAIARTRKPFALKGFRGIDPAHAAALKAAGVADVEQMLARGRTPQGRQELALATGVPPDAILELVKLSDLSRLGAVKGVRARLYYDAGLDTPDKIAAWEPEDLREMLVAWVARTGFQGIAPLPKELRNLVATARSIEMWVEY